MQSPFAVPRLHNIQRGHQFFGFETIHLIEKFSLHLALRDQFQHHDSSFLIAEAGTEGLIERLQGVFHDLGGEIRRHLKRQGFRAVILRVLRLVVVGGQENACGLRGQFFPAQFGRDAFPLGQGREARERVTWFEPFTRLYEWERPYARWFLGGKLNIAYNCVDRHLKTRAKQTAIIWEGDDPKDSRHITYQELHDEVCRMANILRNRNVKKGDRVTIYMPMIPEAAYAMLACSRIGAVHSVVFAGFSAEALRSRFKLNLKPYLPRMTAAHRDAIHGPIPTTEQEEALKLFSAVMKLEPFQRGMKELAPTVWITALRKVQNPNRAGLDIVSHDANFVVPAPPSQRSEAPLPPSSESSPAPP